MAEKRYTKDHEWVEQSGAGTARFGITDHAQEQLGDIVMVELPKVGDCLKQGGECAVIESVKAASDIYAPVSGEIVAVNEQLDENPNLVNESPEGKGWLAEVKFTDAAEFDELMSAKSYEEFVGE